MIFENNFFDYQVVVTPAGPCILYLVGGGHKMSPKHCLRAIKDIIFTYYDGPQLAELIGAKCHKIWGNNKVNKWDFYKDKPTSFRQKSLFFYIQFIITYNLKTNILTIIKYAPSDRKFNFDKTLYNFKKVNL